MSNLRQVVRLFQLNPKYIKKQWIIPIQELYQYTYKDLSDQLELLEKQIPDNHRMYYLEAVRRSLREKTNNAAKRAPLAQTMKDIMRGVE